MLLQLKVSGLVLIDSLDMELDPGFNVLTGETGAGKSLVATAIDLVLGRRARGELVRRGCEEAEVEALFDISDETGVRERLERAGLPVADELLVRRVVPSAGRHRCYINGRLSSLSVLGELAEGLANVMGQHEQHALLDAATQLDLLDGFGRHHDNVRVMAALFEDLQEARRALTELREKEKDRARQLDFLSYQLEELERIDPKPDELESLEVEIERLRHRELIDQAFRQGRGVLYEDDDSVFERLSRVATALEQAGRYDATSALAAQQVREAAALVEEASRECAARLREDEEEGGRLEELEDRREELRMLMRKHGADLPQLVALAESMRTEVATLRDYEAAFEHAEKRVEMCHLLACEHAQKLSALRQAAAIKLGRIVCAELSDLHFAQAKFEVAVDASVREPQRSGIDRVEFLVAFNKGEGTSPLRRVASGGELSRLMLAVKRALAGVGPVGTYVFDEVDTGIGGPAAAAVGRKLREVARHHQVICITHLPQIAGMADAHFFVAKAEVDDRTTSRVERLAQARRVEEIARMLGGEKITTATRKAASELLVRPD
jgi:DNA repair protein RecN (Recombination protein N)